LKKDSDAVASFLDGARGKYKKGDELLEAAVAEFKVDEKKLRESVKEFHHCNCKHGEVGTAVLPAKK
jgi:hypothetical protein